MTEERILPPGYKYREAVEGEKVEVVISDSPIIEIGTVVCKQGQRILTCDGKDILVE